MKHNWRIQADEREGQNGDTITWFAEDRDESGWAVSHMSLAYTLTNSGLVPQIESVKLYI